MAKLGAAALKFDSCPRHGIHPQIHTSSHGRVFPARQSPSSLAARAQRPPWPCRAPSARAQLLCSLASAVLWSVEDLLRAQPELLPWPWPRYSGSSPWRLLGPALSRVCSCARPPARSHAFLSPWTCALRFSLPRPRRGSAQLDLCSSGAVESLRTRCSFPFSSSSARREFSSGALVVRVRRCFLRTCRAPWRLHLTCSSACRASLPWPPWDLLSILRRCLLRRLALEISPRALP